MARTIETTVYQFNELSDKAKDRAREWYRSCSDSDDYSCVLDDVVECARILGIDIDMRMWTNPYGHTGASPKIYCSGFSSQGDGASFDGSYRYAVGASKLIRMHAQNDRVLHDIADHLRYIQKKHFYNIRATCKQSGHYLNSGCMDVSVWNYKDEYRDIGNADNDIRQCMRDFADWIYSRLGEENDYLRSDECVDELIMGNEYEFTKAGERV